MKIPGRIQPLVEEGLIDEVICQLMTGKEAMVYAVQMVYAVHCGRDVRCEGLQGIQQAQLSSELSVHRRAKREKQPPCPGDGEGYALRPAIAGRRVANRRGRLPIPACRRWSTCSQALSIFRGRAPHGTDHWGEPVYRSPVERPHRDRIRLAGISRSFQGRYCVCCAGIIRDLSEYNVLADSHGPWRRYLGFLYHSRSPISEIKDWR